MKMIHRPAPLLRVGRKTAWVALVTFSVAAVAPATAGERVVDPLAQAQAAASQGNAASLLGEPQGPPATPPEATPARPARTTLPKFTPPGVEAPLSATPTDGEIFAFRVFAEPIVPTGPTSAKDNADVAQALSEYRQRKTRDDLEPLRNFVATRPDSPWLLSMLTGLAIAARHSGYYSEAMTYSKRAWEIGASATEPHPKAIAERAFAELVEMYARVGRMDDLDRLFESVRGREFSGSTSEKLGTVRQGLALMKTRPDISFRCGPLAVESVLATLKPGFSMGFDVVEGFSTKDGTTLLHIDRLARQLGTPLVRAKWDAGRTAPPTPAVVHWRAGHFAALVAREGDRYLVKDPTFGSETWVSLTAIRAEASGYFLTQRLPAKWSQVSENEASTIWGKGAPGGSNANHQAPKDRAKCEPCQNGGLATYHFFPMLAGLGLSDIPVGYSPPIGPSVRFELSYSQREQFQGSILTYSNIGPMWTFDWFSYVEDDPSASGSSSVNVYLRSGGVEPYSLPASGPSAPELRSRATVTKAGPSAYVRALPDGSTETFAQPNGAFAYPRRVLLTEFRDPQGQAMTFHYDSQYRLAAITDAMGQVSVLEYGSSDPLKITKITDPFGRSAQLGYDSLGRLSSITDAIGLTSRFTYGAGAFITSLTTPYGTTTFETGALNALDRWVQATDPMGGVERYETHVGGRTALIPATDPSGEVPTEVASSNIILDGAVTYHWNRRLMALAPNDYTKAEQTQWALDHHTVTGIARARKAPLERRVWMGNPDVGSTHPYLFIGPDSRPTLVVRKLDDGTDQNQRYEYNAQGMVTKSIDPLGREMVYEYAANGIDRTGTKRKEGGSYVYLEKRYYYPNTTQCVVSGVSWPSAPSPAPAHVPCAIEDRSGDLTVFAHNARGQVLKTKTPRPSGSTDPITTYNYDTYGYLTSIQGPVAGAQTIFTYDIVGRVRTTTDSTGYMTTTDYDALNRPVKITHPDGTFEAMEYDRLDLARRRDRLGRWTVTAYDPLRRAISVKDPNNGATTYQWCACGTLDALIDANGNKTSWEYDLEGRTTKEIRANGAATTYTYENTTSRLKTRTDRRGVVTTYGYFKDNQLQSRTYSNVVSPVAATGNVAYTYYADTGLPNTVANGTDTLTWAYDGEDRMTSEQSALNGTTVGWSYDSAGNRQTVTLGGATFNSYTYDVTSRLTNIAHGALNFGFGYDTSSRRTSMTYPNGITTTYAYDAESRVTQINAKLGGTDITKFDYGYDKVGNRTYKNTLEFNENYGYDVLDRLTTASRPASSGQPNWLWGYDKVGNRLVDQKGDTSGALATLSSYNALNQLTGMVAGGQVSVEGSTNEAATVTVNSQPATTTSANAFQGQLSAVPPAPGASPTPQTFTVQATDPAGGVRVNTYSTNMLGVPVNASYGYDANGNMTSRTDGTGSWTYAWDAENRLVEVKLGGATQASFRYDPSDRRIEKVAGGNTLRFVYDSEDWIRRTGSALDIVHGPGIDEPMAQESGGTLSYYHADALGSVQKHTSGAGAVLQTAQYDAWGTALSGTPGPYGFTGREPDAETGLQYYRARYYDSKLGRFVSEDPLQNTAALLLAYSYADANPVNRVDPHGLYAMPPPPPPVALVPPAFWVLVVVTVAGVAYYYWVQKETREREYQDYKKRCGEGPPAGLCGCDLLRWQLQQAIDCVRMRQAWDDRWQPGRHATEIRNWQNRVRNLQEKLAKCK